MKKAIRIFVFCVGIIVMFICLIIKEIKDN